MKIRPETLNPENAYYPVAEGDIEPTHRAASLRRLLALETSCYPHCPRCHRALMADGSCPTGDFALTPPTTPLRWWELWKWRPAFRRN